MLNQGQIKPPRQKFDQLFPTPHQPVCWNESYTHKDYGFYARK